MENLKLKKCLIWVVPMIFAFGITAYTIFGNSPSKKEVVSNIMSTKNIRKSVLAGNWYSDDKNELKTQIEYLLDHAKIKNIAGEIRVLISPHAGYAYSGYTAANSYKQIAGKNYDAIIILAPSHREKFEGASVYIGDGYETPLGIVPIHKSLAKEVVANSDVIYESMDGHNEEHSLEIQLPFLQLALSDIKIVPIVVWDYSFNNCQKISKAITKAIKDKNVLIVASTDLYHGYSVKECVDINDKTIEKMLKIEPEELCNGFLNQTYQACGAGPVVIAELIALSKGANKATLLHRTNSSEAAKKEGGYVVGYSSIAIYKEDAANTTNDSHKKVGVELGLNDENKQILLKVAREAIEKAVKGEKITTLKFNTPIMNEHRGAFVTLTKDDMLRGCIGYIVAIKPLAETIQEMAQAAALRDPRFPAVTTDEIADLKIEISVLTPLKVIKDINEIEVGKHGIIIENGYNSGLLLPQVATDYGWNRITFLEHTCQKAGLDKNYWKDKNTVIKIFSADIFHE